MARWTQNIAEVQKLAKNQSQIPISGIVQLSLSNGSIIDGVIRKLSFGNDAGKADFGNWSYYGEIEILTRNKEILTIDLLDIENCNEVWDSMKDEYEKLGVIRIIDYPTDN